MTNEVNRAEKTPKGYGAWTSPIDGEYLAKASKSSNELFASQGHLYFSESRANEGGRSAIMRLEIGSDKPVEVTSPETNVRTRVHEYGGGAWSVTDGVIYYSDDSDGRLRKLDTDGNVTILSPEPEHERSLRYADGRVSPNGKWYVCVREWHPNSNPSDVINQIVAVATDGSLTVHVLARGADFYSHPRLSDCGTKICWIQWDHPYMSWDRSQLWAADFNPETSQISAEVAVAGVAEPESIMECAYNSAGELLAVSDRDEWWNLYRFDPANPEKAEPVLTGSFEVTRPGWVFGYQHWADLDGQIVAAVGDPGGERLITSDGHELTNWTQISTLTPLGNGVAFFAASQQSGEELVTWVPGQTPTVVRSSTPAFDIGFFPSPKHIVFPTAGGEEAHAWFYEPANPQYVGHADELPPLLVLAHGGPTSRARTKLQMTIRYWTSRGFAVVDVDYRGSTGYGRTYRQALARRWGIADVEDACAAATYLAEEGLVDSERLVIKGGSAGGLTVLGALCDTDIFAAGASRYGVADLSGLAAETHKFESRYTNGLVADWPDELDIYTARSPINRIEQLETPMIVLQGGLDVIVLPNQSEAIVAALADRGLTHSYLYFPDEGHGFRSTDAQVTALEGELAFFCHVLGIAEADTIEIDIENPGAI